MTMIALGTTHHFCLTFAEPTSRRLPQLAPSLAQPSPMLNAHLASSALLIPHVLALNRIRTTAGKTSKMRHLVTSSVRVDHRGTAQRITAAMDMSVVLMLTWISQLTTKTLI